MRNSLKIVLAATVGCFVVGAFLAMGTERADARPQYQKQFVSEYKNVTEAKAAKCGVCHPGESKKERNAYGMAIGKSLTGKNVKNAQAIVKAFKSAENEKGSGGKTFGEQLKEGKLPN